MVKMRGMRVGIRERRMGKGEGERRGRGGMG